MDIKDLLHSMHWKSSAAFYRHYMFATDAPIQNIVVPGRILSQPEEEEIRTDHGINLNCDNNQNDTPSSEFSAEF